MALVRKRAPGAGRKPNLIKPFTPATLNGFLRDMKSGTIPLNEVRISDPDTRGLRAVIRATGTITFHANYEAPDGTRPFIKIGNFPELSIERARDITQKIHGLAELGIDPSDELKTFEQRMIRDIEKLGTRWRPSKV